MWIVRLALRNPYSVAVMACLILMAGVLCIKSMLVDIFPVIDLPVVGVIWNYPGLTAEEMEHRIVTINERAFSTTVSSISRMESQSIPGIGNIRIYFEPGTQLGSAVAQISAVCGTILRILPPGITPPAIFPFNASNVPVAQLTISSETLPEEKLFDYGLNFIRVQLFTIPGLSLPAPYGGKTRQINIDVDPALSRAKGLSTQDLVNTLQNSNIIIPAGTARMGNLEYNILMNSSPLQVSQFQDLPVKVVNGRPVTLGQVAHIADSFADQTNIVRINSKRATFLNILKKAEASTLDVVNAVYAKLPSVQAIAPHGMNLKIDFDQSVFVRASISSVIREAVLAAFLVSIMILLFLGNWKSVVIVCTSIPLSILVGIIGLKFSGDSINIMTLGGLSLAVGMLVDDATVEIENINRNIPLSKSITVAILRGAHQIALPAIVSTLAICIVFFPIVLLTGPAKFLFTPMAKSVVYSMLASYVLSRTLVPVLAQILLKDVRPEHEFEGLMGGFNRKREKWLEHFKESYGRLLVQLLEYRRLVLGLFCALFVISALIPLLVIGTDFFPTSDAGIIKFHFRAPVGTRIEVTEQIIAQVEDRIRALIPKGELETINSNIGIPTFYNLGFVPSDNVASMDAEVLIALKKDHAPTSGYIKKLRTDLNQAFPGSSLYFQSGDIVSQVLNFGLSSPIDIQIESKDVYLAYGYAKSLRNKILAIPGTTDVAIKQVFDYPTYQVNVDRVRAAQIGLTEKDVANNMLISLSSSILTAPSFYINPTNGVNYSVVVKVPLEKVKSVKDLTFTPITSLNDNALLQEQPEATSLSGPTGAPTQTLGNLSSLVPTTTLNQVSHFNVQRIVNVTANTEGRDLGSVVSAIQHEIDSLGALPAGTKIHIRGQSEIMHESFTKLGLGMFLAIALVYLLMVILFQSWLDPLIITVAIPGALIGILWMLAITGTSINVVSLMGAIMAVGIAVSNSNLLVSFANEIRTEKDISVEEATVEAGKTRLRPVIMTALAMILGMIPMALSLGEGGDQNAPLGKAVIGGLLIATLTTLLIVPLVYATLRRSLPSKFILQEKYRQEEHQFDEEEAHARKIAV